MARGYRVQWFLPDCSGERYEATYGTLYMAVLLYGVLTGSVDLQTIAPRVWRALARPLSRYPATLTLSADALQEVAAQSQGVACVARMARRRGEPSVWVGLSPQEYLRSLRRLPSVLLVRIHPRSKWRPGALHLAIPAGGVSRTYPYCFHHDVQCVSTANGYRCSRIRGHQGDHRACGGGAGEPPLRVWRKRDTRRTS